MMDRSRIDKVLEEKMKNIQEDFFPTLDYIEQVDLRYPDLEDNEYIVRLAYLNVENGNKTLHQLDEAPTEELNLLSHKVSEIAMNFSKIKTMYELFCYDVSSFINFIEKNNCDTDQIKESQINRYMLHLLSSGKLFVDFNENQIKNKYGEKSNEFLKFHRLDSRQFDTNFSYRFCYYLRNYTQHIGLPISELKLTFDQETELKKLECFLDLNWLLKSTFNWKKIRKELEEKNKLYNLIDVIEIVRSYFESITKLYGEYCKFFLEYNHETLLNMEKELEVLGLHRTTYYSTKITKHDLKYNPTNLIKSPIFGYDKIQEIYLELSKIGLVDIVYK